MSNKVVQFEIWSECNNTCPFCYLRKQMKVLSPEEKINRIQTIIDYISNEENMKNHDGIGIIGGEIFQGQLSNPDVKSKWIEMLKIVNRLEEEDKINNFWVASALLRKDLTDCFDTLDCFSDTSKVLLCTSYDTVGRFINEEQKQLFFNNLDIIRKKYPNIKLHAQVVCTQSLIDEILSGKFDLEGFRQKYNIRVDLSDPWAGYFYKDKYEFEKNHPNFFPKRKSFLEFLRFLHDNTTMNLSWLFSGDFFAETLFTEVEGELKVIRDRHLRNTELPLDIADKSGYIDSNVSMREDVLRYLEELGE